MLRIYHRTVTDTVTPVARISLFISALSPQKDMSCRREYGVQAKKQVQFNRNPLCMHKLIKKTILLFYGKKTEVK